jgi:hypothetical protein
MNHLSIHPAKKISAEAIENLCATMTLTLTMRGSLKSLPANIHWHYKKGKEKGVLEITLMQQRNEIILSCKENRSGPWIMGIIEEFRRKLE